MNENEGTVWGKFQLCAYEFFYIFNFTPGQTIMYLINRI